MYKETIYEDIANFFKLKTENLHQFKKIMSFIVTIPPGKLSIHNLAKNLGVDDKTVANYLAILNETNLVRLIFANVKGNQVLRKPEKIVIDNTNLHYALSDNINSVLEIGAVRELYFLQSLCHAGHHVFYSEIGNFVVNDNLFEISGKNKSRHQVKSQSQAFLVKDDILISGHRIIPLYYFGFLY